MAVDKVLQTYGDSSRKEDVVLNMVEILTAEENQLLATLGKTDAKDEVHSFLVDTLATPASAAVQQGADFTYLERTTPTRLTNLVEEIAIPFRVTKKQQSVEHYHGRNELERQLSKALMEWGNAAEFDIVRSTLVSGVSGTVTKMNGIIAAIAKSTNLVSYASGTLFSASILDIAMESNWTNSNGDVAQDAFVGGTLRRQIDGFTQKTNVVVNNAGMTSIVRTVSTYETAFGTLTLHAHRYIQQTADATARILAVRKEKIKLAYLNKPTVMTDLAKAGAYDPRSVYGALTVEVNNQDSNWFGTGFLK